jgi:DNA-3-methyladenine glycosylase I
MGAMPDGVTKGEDGISRCRWGNSAPEYAAYHDTEWGFPVADDVRLFEKLSLEGFQSGLSWLTILRKREGFRKAFKGFDPNKVARFGEKDVQRLLGDASIIRHRGKIEAVINNAQRMIELRESDGSLAAYVWRFEPERQHRDESMPSITPESQGPEEARLAVRRADHGVRLHAGHGPGQRSRQGLRRAAESAGRARRVHRAERGPCSSTSLTDVSRAFSR